MRKLETIDRYPLTWPDGWRRTKDRIRARFHKSGKSPEGWNRKSELSVAQATERVFAELRAMNIPECVISTNIVLRLDGLPRSDQKAPADPGAAVYWRHGRETRCMAVDHYDRVADNLAAIAATLDAMRAISRHGGAQILDRAFIGFKQLTAPEQPWQVLGLDTSEPSVEQVQKAYLAKAKTDHPDAGGADWKMARLNTARDALMEKRAR